MSKQWTFVVVTLSVLAAAFVVAFYWLFLQPGPVVATRLLAGPVAAIETDRGFLLRGPASSFRPGEHFGYAREICVQTPVELLVMRRLHAMDDGRVYMFNSEVISERAFEDHACIIDRPSFIVPPEAVAGTYHLINTIRAAVNPLRDQVMALEPIVLHVESER